MSHFKEIHSLVFAEGGEGRLPEGWTIRWIGKNLYRLYLESPDKVTLSGSADVKRLTISKGFRLIRIEWSFNDATSKDFKIEVEHPHMNQLDNPTMILNLTGDVNKNGYKTYGEKYEYEGGATLVFTVTGTLTKTFSPTAYIQVLEGKP